MTYVYCALNLYVDSVRVSNLLVTQGTSEIFLRHSCTSNRTVTFFFIEVQVQRTLRQMHRAQINTTLSSQGRLMQTAERFSFSFHLLFYDNKKHSQKHLFTKDSQTRYLNPFCKQTHLVLICFLKEQTLLIINAKVIVFKVNRLNDGFCIFPYCFILNTIKTSSW